MNQELIRQLKYVKQCIVNKEMRGNDWEEQQEAVNKLEEVLIISKMKKGKRSSSILDRRDVAADLKNVNRI